MRSPDKLREAFDTYLAETAREIDDDRPAYTARRCMRSIDLSREKQAALDSDELAFYLAYRGLHDALAPDEPRDIGGAKIGLGGALSDAIDGLAERHGIGFGEVTLGQVRAIQPDDRIKGLVAGMALARLKAVFGDGPRQFVVAEPFGDFIT